MSLTFTESMLCLIMVAMWAIAFCLAMLVRVVREEDDADWWKQGGRDNGD